MFSVRNSGDNPCTHFGAIVGPNMKFSDLKRLRTGLKQKDPKSDFNHSESSSGGSSSNLDDCFNEVIDNIVVTSTTNSTGRPTFPVSFHIVFSSSVACLSCLRSF
jgi:hypothetical protein